MFKRSKRRKREPILHAHNAGYMLDPALVASNSLDRRSTTEIPQHRTPGCTNLQFRFMSACESQKLKRRTFVHKQDPTDHQTELQVEHFKCTPEPKSIFAADRTRVRAPQDALVSEKRH